MTKVCTKCGIEKMVGDFTKRKASSDGVSCWCKNCSRLYMLAWRQLNPSSTRSQQIKTCFGITQEQYLAMLAQQNNSCACCGDSFDSIPPVVIQKTGKPRAPHIDHCHTTGKVRGILCNGCNTGLGLFKDSPKRLQLAAQYLLKSSR